MNNVIPITSDRVVTVPLETRIPAMVIRFEMFDLECNVEERQRKFDAWALGKVSRVREEAAGMGGSVEVEE